MKTPRIIAFVLAGGQGSRLMPLTAEQAKPALPLTEGYRLIDFVLSNLLLSRVGEVVVLAQYKPASLVSHVGAVWSSRFAAIGGRLQTRVAECSDDTPGYQGTADAVYQNRSLIAQYDPDLVGVFAADHVYRMDIRQMARSHRDHRADLTVAAVQVPLASASSFGVIGVDRDGMITQFTEKPVEPPPLPHDPSVAFASMGNYLFEPSALLELLTANARRGGTDFGYHVLPNLPPVMRAHAYDFAGNRIPGLRPWEDRGYWRDVGTVSAFAETIREISAPRGRFVLHNPRWPILGEQTGYATVPVQAGRVQSRSMRSRTTRPTTAQVTGLQATAI